MSSPYRILARKRCGERLPEESIRAVVQGATDGSWSDAQLAAFLMAAAIRGLDPAETRDLTLAMLESGEQWDLAAAVPTLTDKHSTGGVGDKASLVLSPLLAACDLPVVMLTGRGLGHTGGTADKLEFVPGLDLGLDRGRCLRLLDEVGVAIGVATGGIAPADRCLYRLRDLTATVDSLSLITASILSKKLATGAAAVVFDVKVGSGAFLPEVDEARKLARLLVDTTAAMGRRASALLTDMSQPLGRWVGHTAELGETFDCLEGRGPDDLMEVVYRLAEELAALVGADVGRRELESAIASGAARERFTRWAIAQGGDPAWLETPELELAPHVAEIRAPRSGLLAAVDNRRIGLLLAEAGGGRTRAGDEIDPGVSLHYQARLGQNLIAGAEIASLHLRHPDDRLTAEMTSCFEIADEGAPPPLIEERITAASE